MEGAGACLEAGAFLVAGQMVPGLVRATDRSFDYFLDRGTPGAGVLLPGFGTGAVSDEDGVPRGKADCAACRHVALLTPETLFENGPSFATKVLDLKDRLRCRGRRRKGRAEVSIKWRDRSVSAALDRGRNSAGLEEHLDAALHLRTAWPDRRQAASILRASGQQNVRRG